MHLNSQVLEKLSSEYGEAFYVLHADRFERNIIELKSSFQDIYPKFGLAILTKPTTYLICVELRIVTGYTPKLFRTWNWKLLFVPESCHRVLSGMDHIKAC